MIAALVGSAWLLNSALAQDSDLVGIEKTALGAQELAIIVNTADPQSIRVAEYYKKIRRIPNKNLIRVQFTPDISVMSQLEFQRIKAMIDAATPAQVQSYALTWTKPYRAGCMSITTAFAAGFDPAFCSEPCSPTKPNPYFNSPSRRPYDDHGLRPAMMLAGKSFKEVKKLIDRGVASDATFPRGAAYLVSTSDKSRNIRAGFYPEIMQQLKGGPADLRMVKADYIEKKSRVLFYFTGAKQVNALNTIRFLPGAIGDHLTSAGGQLTSSGDQMSSLRWLEAGATGSYGAVVEPCNFPAKFPHPGIVIDRYTRGETLIESYWKSVAWPGEGIFIGEPLAAPYAVRPSTIMTNSQ
ncbi:MAG: TIGR03790 family protein [Sulfuricaulis sp.]|uniref:TIGR03790 family protein n=1 Tax=Sulfuricaulis sp. TaxID=2003553 RepID=UPI0025DAF069|nr:TIGR03790 family protein [Sulfuricaulis sp.]MCR4347333.1 TIGR03790 family protein [Sulfuricaulis sp.]